MCGQREVKMTLTFVTNGKRSARVTPMSHGAQLLVSRH